MRVSIVRSLNLSSSEVIETEVAGRGGACSLRTLTGTISHFGPRPNWNFSNPVGDCF